MFQIAGVRHKACLLNLPQFQEQPLDAEQERAGPTADDAFYPLAFGWFGRTDVIVAVETGPHLRHCQGTSFILRFVPSVPNGIAIKERLKKILLQAVHCLGCLRAWHTEVFPFISRL